MSSLVRSSAIWISPRCSPRRCDVDSRTNFQLQPEALRGGLADELPDRARQVAATLLPVVGNALELVEIAGLGATQAERA
jgi:hypothetical protein